MKIVSIVGKKNTGKTSLTTKIINELTQRGYNVASIKHSHHSIEMDKENTDTWKHKQAGSQLVVGVGSTTFFNSKKEHNLNRILYLLKHFDDFDYIIIEGYKNYNYPKIITSPDVKDKYTICEVNSFTITDEEIKDLTDLIEKRGHDITDTLFANNCGFNNGEKIAEEIRNGNLTTDELDKTHSYISIDGKVVGLNKFVSDYLKQNIYGIINTLNLKDFGVNKIGKIEIVIPENKKNNTKIKINDKNLTTNEFTKDIIRNSTKAMLNSLKIPQKYKNAYISIQNITNLENAEITILIDDVKLHTNKFSQNILKQTIYSIINTLKIDEEIKKIEITLNE